MIKTKKWKRLLGVASILGLLCVTLYLINLSFRDHLVFFLTPSEIIAKQTQNLKIPDRIRLGGLVKEGSITIIQSEQKILSFVVTDAQSSIRVHYRGFLPDLFREGQGVVAEGTYDQANTIFMADTILAKHDETYKPIDLKSVLDPEAKAKVETSLVVTPHEAR